MEFDFLLMKSIALMINPISPAIIDNVFNTI